MKFSVAMVTAPLVAKASADASVAPHNRISRIEESNPEEQSHWWDLGLADEVLNEVGLYYLGQSWYQATDVAEMLETFSRCDASDPWSWTTEFRKTADRLEELAKESTNVGHHRSAGQYYLRAATYRRAALHRHPDPYHSEVSIQASMAVDHFEKFLSEYDYPCKPVSIPYEDGNNQTMDSKRQLSQSLPGYLCINPNNIKGAAAPTIIFQEGKDGWAEDGKFMVDEAHARGYNVLLFDGPGIGKVIRLQGLPFRHDWEAVITPIVDYLTGIEEVDSNNIALVAVSLGGYLGTRAVAYEKRIKALVVNPGVMDWSKIYTDFLDSIDPNLVNLLDTDPQAFDETIYQIMTQVPLVDWGMVDSQWHHNTTNPSGLMAEILKFKNYDIVEKIEASIMIIDADDETRGQSKELYDSLVNSPVKTYSKFTREEAAQFHVQPGATGIMSARVFDWLDDILAMDLGKTNAIESEENNSGSVHCSHPMKGMISIVIVAFALV